METETKKKSNVIWIVLCLIFLIAAVFFLVQYTRLINAVNEEAHRRMDLERFVTRNELYKVGDIELEQRSEDEIAYEFGLDPDQYSQMVWYASDRCDEQILLLECSKDAADIEAIAKLVQYQEYYYGYPYYDDIHTWRLSSDYVLFAHAGGSVDGEMFYNNFIRSMIYDFQ